MKGKTLLAAAQKIDRFFNEAAGPAEFEPQWLHPLHQEARSVMDGSPSDDPELREDLIPMASQIGRSRPIVDRVFGPRFLEDGWKQGTTSWVFLGRKKSPIRKRIGSRVVIGRPMRDGQLVYAAYHLTEPMGMSAMTDNVVGPSCDLIEVEYWCHRENQSKAV